MSEMRLVALNSKTRGGAALCPGVVGVEATERQAIRCHRVRVLKHDRVRFSKKGGGSYDKIIRNICLLVGKEFPARVRINYTDKNLCNVQKIADDLAGIPKSLRETFIVFDFHRVWQNEQKDDLNEMLNFSLEFESKAVKCYNEALALAGGDRALEIFLENILEEEQDGVDKLTRILRDPKAVAASTSAAKAG